MSLTLTQNPVTGSSEIFAGFQPIEFKFKREDLAVVDVASGVGGIIIGVGSDLTSLLAPGDTIYIYSEGADYTYNGTGTILSITATDITIDIPFIQAATGGYINYLKNYYVEMMLVDKTFSNANKLPFTLQSDGDAAGNISIDVSVINDLNRARGTIADGRLSEGVQEFEVKYREVYDNYEPVYTLIDSKLLIVIYSLENPELNIILNRFDLPKLYLGYPAGLVVARKGGLANETIKITYQELDVNKVPTGAGMLTEIDAELNGLIMWEWAYDKVVDNSTEFVNFDFGVVGIYDFAAPDFAYPDFVTQ